MSISRSNRGLGIIFALGVWIRIAVVSFLGIVALACDQDAVLLAPDGTYQLDHCYPDKWIQCITDKCPSHGFEVVVLHDNPSESSVIRCKAVPADGGIP